MTLVAARQVADAVLYEGYLLYPYRASSSKNQVRWQFGVLGPKGAEEAGAGEATSMSAQLLVQPSAGAAVTICLRFLQVQSRRVQQRTETGADDGWLDVQALTVGDARWIPYHEAVPREVELIDLTIDQPHTIAIELEGGTDVEDLDDGGHLVGRLVRTRWPLRGSLTVTPRRGQDPRLVVLELAVVNLASWAAPTESGWTERDVAARASFVGTHLLVTAHNAELLSLLEGPDWASSDAQACVQSRCWPVLIHDDASKDAALVAPIILGDHPAIAPESAGDLFDATEIDEILTLRIMTLSEQEKAEARGTDPRAAAILARCDATSDAVMEGLHGARRGDSGDGQVPVFGEQLPQAAQEEPPWWDAAEDARAEPELDAVMVGGVPVSKGTRVLLRPSRRADAQDIFLAGMTAVVARVYFDVDGGTHLAVALEDDPAADLYATTGRFYYFGPEELEPLGAREEAR